MKQAETTVSEAGIAAGAVPSPLEMPSIFMLGHIVTGDVIPTASPASTDSRSADFTFHLPQHPNGTLRRRF